MKEILPTFAFTFEKDKKFSAAVRKSRYRPGSVQALLTLQSGIDPLLANHSDGPLSSVGTDQNLWENSSHFKPLDSSGLSDASRTEAPARSPKEWPPADLARYKANESRAHSA